VSARTFTRGCVASPHYLASAAGLRVLGAGGNALDAAIATNLALSVVTPYMCGFGGDLFAIVWDGAALHAYNGSGRAPAAATADAVRAAAGSTVMPVLGPLSVTVPGAVEAWFTLIDRFGTRSFEEVAVAAADYARDGFVPTAMGAALLARGRGLFDRYGAGGELYGRARAGERFRQPAMTRLIELLAKSGPEPYYRGEVAAAIAACVQAAGGLMVEADLAEHRGDWVETLASTYRDLDVHEMPPNSQGVTALIALNIVEALGISPSCGLDEREHLHIEAIKLALRDRDQYVSDPAAMTVDPFQLASKAWAAAHAATIDSERAQQVEPGRPALGGTIYLCAADDSGMCVSLIQSNYRGFGSGVHEPEWGVNLQNRGAYFTLDDHHVNVIAPRKRTMHTLMPAMAMRGGRPAIVFGTMGADGQAQTQLQMLTKVVDDGTDLQDALDAPRWVVSPSDFSVTLERRFPDDVVEGLRRRGHVVHVTHPLDRSMGHANAIIISDDGFVAASDPRSEGAALGI
jgi:gamma-glutamyltranspeptidase/glutathione hydrolase